LEQLLEVRKLKYTKKQLEVKPLYRWPYRTVRVYRPILRMSQELPSANLCVFSQCRYTW